MEFETQGEVFNVESNQFDGKTYRKALIQVNGHSYIVGLKSGTTVPKGKQSLVFEFSTFGSDLKPIMRIVGDEIDEGSDDTDD